MALKSSEVKYKGLFDYRRSGLKYLSLSTEFVQVNYTVIMPQMLETLLTHKQKRYTSEIQESLAENLICELCGVTEEVRPARRYTQRSRGCR